MKYDRNQRKYLVFLDIDGVFTSSRVHYAHGAQYDKWHRFDQVATDFMNKIHDKYPVEFLLMSTWKDSARYQDEWATHWMKAAFANSGFRGKFADPWKTDPDGVIRARHGTHRGDEVLDYLENHAPDVEDYVLFDDDRHNFSKVLPKNRLILTDSENGLLYKHMTHAMSLIGQWKER